MPPTCRARKYKIQCVTPTTFMCHELGRRGGACGTTAATRRRIMAHIDTMHRPRRHACATCFEMFNSARARDVHVLEEHGTPRTCTKCTVTRLVHEPCPVSGFVCAQCTRSDMRLEKCLERYCRAHAAFGKFAIYDTPLSATCARRPDQLIYGPGNLVIIGELDEDAHRDRKGNYHSTRERAIRDDPSMKGKIVVVVHLSMNNALVDHPHQHSCYFRRYVELVEALLTMRGTQRACNFYIGDKPYDINGDVPAIIEA